MFFIRFDYSSGRDNFNRNFLFLFLYITVFD